MPKAPNAKNGGVGQMSENALIDKMKKLQGDTDDKRAARRMVSKNKDTIKELLDTLDSKPKFTKMVEYSVKCLQNLAVDAVSVEEMIDLGALDTLQRVLQLNPYNEAIMQTINNVLQAFTKNDQIAAKIAKQFGGTGLVLSLKKHVETVTLEGSCKTMAKLVRGPEAADIFVKDGAIPALEGVLKRNGDHQGINAGGVECLERLAGYRDYALQIASGDSAKLALDALKRFPENTDLVTAGISLLGKLARASPECAEMLKKLGAVDVISSCLEMHGNDRKLEDLGGMALRSLAGADDVVGCLSVTPGLNSATASALGKLSSLMLVPENIETLLRHEGVDWILTAVRSCIGDPSPMAAKILASGARALARIAADEQKAYLIIKKHGVKTLVTMLQQHAENEEVGAASLRALTKLVSRHENGTFIVQSGALGPTLALFKQHPESDAVAQSCLEFYSALANYKECRKELTPDTLQDVIAIVGKHGPVSDDIALAGINTLGRMCDSKQSTLNMIKMGGLTSAVAAVNAQIENPKLCTRGLLLLETGAACPEVLDSWRASGGMDCVLSVLEKYPENMEIQMIGTRVMGLVAGEAQLVSSISSVKKMNDSLQTAKTVDASMQETILSGIHLVSGFALVDSNAAIMLANDGVETLLACFNSAGLLPDGLKRDQAMVSTLQGMLRLAKDQKAAQAIMNGAFGPALSWAIRSPNNEELAEATMSLAVELLAHPQLTQPMLRNISELIQLAKMHPYNEGVLRAVTKALAILAIDEASCQSIITFGGASVITDSLSVNVSDDATSLLAIQLISQLSDTSEAVHSLVDANAIDAILGAMRRHPSNVDVILCGCQALCRLLVEEEIGRLIATRGGCPILVKAMREHFEHEGICETDMVLLASLATITENAEDLKVPELETVALVKWIKEAWADNAVLQDSGDRILAILCPPTLQLHDSLTMLTDETCAALMKQLKNEDGKLDHSQLQTVTENLAQLCLAKHNAQICTKHGALPILTKMMKDYAQVEGVFYAAASAFATITEHGGDDLVLDDDIVLEGISLVINPNKKFAAALNLADLTKAIGVAAKMKLKPEAIENLLKTVPLNALLDLLVDSDDPMLLAQTARLLCKISNDEKGALALGQITDLRELIAAMRRNIQNEEFLKYGIYLLSNLCTNDAIKAQVGSEGGILLILKVMELYMKNEGLIENCCFALGNLSFEHEINSSFIVACKGIEIIVLAIQTHGTSEDLLESAVATLCNLCHNSDVNKDQIVKKDGCIAVVEVVLNNFNSIDLLLTCFRTLGNLASNGPNTSAIIKAGGVQGIVAGLTVHSSELQIIDISIRVLTNLASEMDDDEQKIMAQEGAVQAIVEVVNSHVDNPDLELSALGCLCNLARAPFNASMIIKQGGTEATLQVMQEQKGDPELIERSMSLIAALSLIHDGVGRILEAGASKGVVNALNAHMGSQEVSLAGLCAITNMAYSTATATQIAVDRPIECVLAAIRQHVNFAPVITEGFKALGGLCRAEANAVQMAEPAFNLLPKTFKASEGDVRALTATFDFLGNVCVHEKAAAFVPKTEVVRAALACLKEQRSRPPVQMRICQALNNMTFCSQEVRDYMKSCLVVQAMEQLINDTQRDDVREHAKNVIEGVNRTKAMESSATYVTMKKPVRITKSAKELFGDAMVKKLPELSREMRNFLLAGQLLKKHGASTASAPKTRMLLISDDLKWVICKDPHQPVDPKQKLKVFKIKAIEKGRCTPALQRKRFGKFLAKEECCFSIIGRDKSYDMECESEANRDEWVAALQVLVDYVKLLKQANKQFN